MKLKFPSVSKEVKQTLIGGALAGAIVGFESGASWFVAGYPQILKDRISPVIPRNGALLADLAPAGTAYYMKKRGSERTKNMATGVLLYDLPKLLDEFAYSIAYQMGLPAAGLGTRSFNVAPTRYSRPPMVGSTPMVAGVGGKYVLKATPAKSMGGGIGRYR